MPALACPRCRACPAFPRSRTQPQPQRVRDCDHQSPCSIPIFCLAVVNFPKSTTCLPTVHSLRLHPPLSCHRYPSNRRVEITLRSPPNQNPCRRSTLPAFYPSPFPSLSASAADWQIALHVALESSTGIAQASCSYSQSPPSFSPLVSAQPCPALLETEPPGLPSPKRARHHIDRPAANQRNMVHSVHSVKATYHGEGYGDEFDSYPLTPQRSTPAAITSQLRILPVWTTPLSTTTTTTLR